MMKLLFLFSVALLCLQNLKCSNILSTSMNPIILKLRRYNSDNKTSTIKTKALFFNNVLDLKPGNPFELNIDKWIALQRSGLFSNLTAKSVVIRDSSNISDTISLEISGIENPTTTFSPELGFSLSVSPEVCGGIVYRDRNFRGMGENLEILFQKSESREEGVNELPPTLKMSWNANKIGQNSFFSLGVEDISFMQYMKNMIPSVVQKIQFKEYTRSLFRVSAQSAKVFLQKEGFLYSKKRGNLNNTTKGADSEIRRMDYSVQGYMSQLSSSTSPKFGKQEYITGNVAELDSKAWEECSFLTLNGIKSTIAESRQSGAVIQGWHEGGFLRILGGEKLFPFNQLGARVSFPAALFTLNEKLSQSAACLKLSVNAMRAWGDGCLPLFHLRSAGDANVVRAFPVSESTVHNHLLGHVSVKSDVYFDKLLSFCTVGLFLDAMSCVENEQKQTKWPFFSAGVSVRAKGFRVDVGTPLLSDRRVFRIQLGQDLERY